MVTVWWCHARIIQAPGLCPGAFDRIARACYYARAVHVFLILSIPLAYVYLLVLREQTGRTAAMTAAPAVKGVLSYLLVLVPLLLIDRFVARPFAGSDLYIYGTVYDFAVPGLIAFLLYLRLVPDVGGLTPDERFLSLLSFYAGVFTLAGLMDLFLRADYHGAYELFMLPALRIAFMLYVPSLYYRFSSEASWIRYLYLLLMCGVPFALGLVPLAAAMYLGPASVLATVGLLIGACAVALFGAGGIGMYRFR